MGGARRAGGGEGARRPSDKIRTMQIQISMAFAHGRHTRIEKFFSFIFLHHPEGTLATQRSWGTFELPLGDT